MFEILIYLFESYFDAGSYPEPDKLSRKLSAAGFEGDEISEALTWLSALQEQNPDSYPASLEHTGQRHFAELELQFIGDEARQFLLFAEQQHLISAIEREMTIDRSVALRQKNLGLDKLKLIMLMVLWNRHQDLDPLLVEELLTPLHSAQLH
ncbi:MAG: Smg family protein [Gallionella sp.]|jgi:Smg protein